MRKLLFVLMLSFLILPSCRKKKFDLKADEERLSSLPNSAFATHSFGFQTMVDYQKKSDTGEFLYRFILNNPVQDYTDVRFVFTPEEGGSYFMAGYQINYSLSPDVRKIEKRKNIRAGFALYFSLTAYSDTFKVLFQSKETEEIYFAYVS